MAAKRKRAARSRSTDQSARLERLNEQNRALRKTVHALMDRVERAMDDHGTPFFWFQAAAQLEAACAVRPIDEAVVYSRGEARRRAFAEECSARLGITVRAVDRPQDAAACDIVATITNATDPVLDAGGVGRGTHINAAGNNRADDAEIAADLLDAASMVFIDDIQQGKAEAGEIIRAVDAGGFAWNRVAELGDLVAGRVSGRSDAAEITLFKSIGIAIEDIAVARRVYALATARGAGEALPGSSLWSTID